MVKDLINLFKKAYEQNGDKMVLDIYKPKEGLYIKINEDKSIEKLCINKNTPTNTELYKWFRDRDYYSNLVDMNKPVDPKKKIHSNNVYTIFIKKDVFPGIIDEKSDKKPSDKRLNFEDFTTYINGYYNVLIDSKKDTTTQVNEFDKTFLMNLLCKKEDFDELLYSINKENFKNYIKLFFNTDLDSYISVGRKYLIPKIYNDNQYNVIVNDITLGLSNDNMGMNAKKPYLEHKNTKYKVPFRITIEEALLSKTIFDWFMCQETNDIYIPEDYDFTTEPNRDSCKGSCYYFRVKKSKSAEIQDFEFISSLNSDIDFHLRNYLEVEGLDNGYKQKISELEELVSEYFFMKSLKNAYFQEVKDIKVRGLKKSEDLKNILIINLTSFHNYFKKSKLQYFKETIGKVSADVMQILFNSMETVGTKKIQNAFNLRMSILNHFKIGGYKMGDIITPIRKEIFEKIKGQKESVINSDEEFYFLSGQIAYYLFTKSKAQNRKYNMLEPFFRSKTCSEFKKQLNYIFDYYKHEISIDDTKFRTLLGMVEGYDANVGICDKKDMFMAGFLAKNIMFTKREEM
ncbi:UNVERIFIED_CONTAM: CRISPR-associated protein Csh1 [Acetivibrio alkalicellulosi]